MRPDPPGLDLRALAPHLDALLGGLAGPLHAEVVPGGLSNLTYVVTDQERSVVLRRPPLAHVLPTAHDMRREYTVQRALGSAGFPVPRMLALCTDDTVIGAPFYVMELVSGHVVRTELPPELPDTPQTRRRMSEALVATLVRLHRIDPDGVGLGDFGRPEGFLERQVRRWWQQWLASRTRELPAMDRLHRLLESSIPRQGPAAIVHGDYRLDNLMFAPGDPSRVGAVLDWEMSTLGDPLCDLGLLLVYWAEPDDDPAVQGSRGHAVTCEPGFFRRSELLSAYQAATACDLSGFDWYVALGAYKLAVVMEGIAARYLLGMTVGEGFETAALMVPALVARGLDAMGGAQRR